MPTSGPFYLRVEDKAYEAPPCVNPTRIARHVQGRSGVVHVEYYKEEVAKRSLDFVFLSHTNVGMGG